MTRRTSNTTAGRALALAYGAIAVLAAELKEGIDPESPDEAAQQLVHELREVDMPELTPWLRDVLVDAPLADEPTPDDAHERVTWAIELLGQVFSDLSRWRETLQDDYEPVPSEIDELMMTLDDDVVRLDSLELPS